MNKKYIFLSFILGMTSLKGQVADPLDDYSNHILQEQERFKFNYWNGTNKQPSGGMVVRFRYDFTGDGKDDYLYRSTISPSEQWTMYRSQPNGYKKSKEGIKLSNYISGYIRKEEKSIVVTSIQEKLTWMTIVQNSIFPDGDIVTQEPRVIDGYENIQKEKKQVGWPEAMYGKNIVFENAEIASLQDILLKEEPMWVKYDHQNFFNNQHNLKGKIRQEMFEIDLSPDVAIQAANKNSTQKRTRVFRANESHDAVSRANQKGVTRDKENPKSLQKSSHWIYILLVVILTIGGVWYMKRKNT